MLMYRKRIVSCLGAALSIVGITMTLALPASAAPKASDRPAAMASGPFNIWEANGRYAVYAASTASNTHVTEGLHPGSGLTWTQTGTYLGHPSGVWKFPGGNEMAANSACTAVVVHPPGTFGTVWVEYITGGHLYYLARACDLGDLQSGFLCGRNVRYDQWLLGYWQQPGCLEAITLN